MVKIVDGGEFDVAKRTVAATKLEDGDEVVLVAPMLDQQGLSLAVPSAQEAKQEIKENKIAE